jgi:citrate synthase
MAGGGLEGVVAATTELSEVDGERGELVIAGYRIGDLAAHATFEETTWLLWNGNLPSAAQLDAFRSALAAARDIPESTLVLLRACASRRVDAMDALRMAAGTLSLISDDAAGIVARMPTIVAAYSRLCAAQQPVAPRRDLGHAANFLYMLSGGAPDPERVRGLETYLNTVIDHGFNASTFAARVITSTGSDLVSAIVGALGALKGPLHGGAPGPALDMVFEIGDASRAEEFLRRKIEAGEKLMGFGHRIYKVRDPRADVLATAAERLFTRAGDMSLYSLARFDCSKRTSRVESSRRMWSSTRRCFFTAWDSTWRCLRRPSRSAASADGSRMHSSSAAPPASFGRSRNTLVQGAGVGCPWLNEPS